MANKINYYKSFWNFKCSGEIKQLCPLHIKEGVGFIKTVKWELQEQTGLQQTVQYRERKQPIRCKFIQ